MVHKGLAPCLALSHILGQCRWRSNLDLLLCLPQSLSPQDRAAYKEYISNVSLGAGPCRGQGGFGAGRCLALTAVPLSASLSLPAET